VVPPTETFEAGITRAIRGLCDRLLKLFVDDQTPPAVARAVLLRALWVLSEDGRFRTQVERELLAQSSEAARVLLEAFERQAAARERDGA
jgi:hypothetical protein